MATQFHGCGEAQRVVDVEGQAVPVLIVYCGLQPFVISSLRFGTAGSQSTDWFWLPTTRSTVIGSLTDCAFWRLCTTPISVTRLCGLPVVESELAYDVRRPALSSARSAKLIGPERSGSGEAA